MDDFSTRGRRKTEEQQPELVREIHALVDPQSQADPKFQTPLAFTRMTAKVVRERLAANTSEKDRHVPAERTLYDILNRSGLSVAARSQDQASKKLPETDAIFNHLRQIHTEAAQDPQTLRISLDTKAKVKIGEFSRGGLTRGQESVRAADHDMHPDAVLVPAGILEVNNGQLNVVFGTSRDTSDFVADCLELCRRRWRRPSRRLRQT